MNISGVIANFRVADNSGGISSVSTSRQERVTTWSVGDRVRSVPPTLRILVGWEASAVWSSDPSRYIGRAMGAHRSFLNGWIKLPGSSRLRLLPLEERQPSGRSPKSSLIESKESF